jgi:predicted permease
MVALVLLGLVAGVLLIACANVTSLLLARAAARERELAVRSALGASRGRLVRQALTESLLLSLGGAVAGCALAQVLLRIFVAAAPEGIPLLSKARIDMRIVAFTFLVSAICAVLSGLVPALHKPRAEALAGRTMISSSHALLRQWLVVAQIATSLVLLVGGALLFRSFLNLERQRLGMQTERVATASLSLGQKAGTPEHTMAFFQELERSLRYAPGVTALAVSDTLPPGGYHRDQVYASIAIDDRPKPASGTGGLVAWRWVTPDYFRALDIPIAQGRGFTEEDQNSQEHFVVLSWRLAQRMFPGQNPVGHTLRLAGWIPENNPQYTVVGVAADVKNAGLAGEDEPEYYRLRRNQPEDWTRASSMIMKSTLPPDSMKQWIRTQVAALDPTLPVEVETMAERVSKMADRPRFESLLVGLFAIVGFVLAMIGLYGVIAFLVAQRTQEIGVRMALGADRADILRLVMKRSVRLVIAGVIAGLVASLAASRVLSRLLFQVGPHDPVTFGSVTLLLIGVALAATLIPARSASRVNPSDALRAE